MLETPSIKSIEPFIMFDLPETPIEPLFYCAVFMLPEEGSILGHGNDSFLSTDKLILSLSAKE